MRRLALILGMLLAGTAAAAADECIVGTIDNSNYAPDDTSIVIGFDDFRAFVNNPGHCNLVFNAHDNLVNNPDLFEVYSADYRGAVSPGPDELAEATVDHNGRTDVLTQPDTAAVFGTHYIGKESDGTIREEIGYELIVATDPGSEASLDSIDYALAGTMTRADAEDSLTSVALDQVGLVTHLDATTGLLTGLSLEGENEAGVFGGLGSYALGVRGRYNLGEGLSLLGGVSLVDQSPGAHYAGLIGAGALRYVQPDAGQFRLMGEAGVEAGGLGLQFTRNYIYSDTTPTIIPVTATGSGTATLGAIYGKAGLVFAPDADNQVLISASIKQTFLGFTNYQEEVSADNLFATDLSGVVQRFTTVKIGADWTTALAPDLSLTSSVALGTTLGSAPQAYIFGGGDVTGAAASTLFAQYGVDLGWQMAPEARIDGFIQGSTGTGIGSHAMIGAAYTTSF
ncbi:MAG: hypothetical protein ABIO40_00770 [Devosia sp.]